MPRSLPGDPAPWTLVGRRYLFQRPPWLVLREDHVRLPSGAEIPAYWISEYPPWVNVVAVTTRHEIVLIRQYRPGIDGVFFELPAGVVDPGDPSLETAARRELSEETGYGGGRWSSLGALSANPALQTNLTHTWLAEDVEPLAAARPESTEDLRVHLVPVNQILPLVEADAFAQALHVAPLLRYLLTRVAR